MTESGSVTATDKVAFGRYKLLHLLAQGGMGEVYLAKLSGAAGFEKLCVLKTILPNFSEAEDFVQRFHHEAKTLVQLNHANIAQIYDMGEADKTYYMALEYVAGVDLARVQKRAKEKGSPIPIPIAIFVGQRIAEALGYAHRKTDAEGKPMSIVHRDMSPHNVLVSYEGEVKVIDFGLAKSAARSLHTMPSTVLGKLGYMSPEQARAEEIDRRSDIFSAGVVVWEILAGRPMVKRGTFAEMLGAMANPKIPRLSDIRPEISPELSDIVQKSLEFKPDERYARADDFAAALNEEFVRHKPPMTAERVGDFIRQLCPDEFEQQRKMLSGISILGRQQNEVQRRPSIRPTKMERSRPRTTEEDAPDATSLRKSSPPEQTPDEVAAVEAGPTVMRPSELRAVKKPNIALFAAVGGAVGVAVIVGVALLLRSPPPNPTPTPNPEPVKPPLAVVPTPPPPITPPATPPEPNPNPPSVAVRPPVIPPVPPPVAQPSGAARKAALEHRMDALRQKYDALVSKVGADQVQPMVAAAYEEARNEFKRGIANPRSYSDLDEALRDAEGMVNKERRRLGQ
jgi:eukaryotic-like serine/threonine-protein kinase